MMAINWRRVSEVPEYERPDCWTWITESGSLTERVRNLDSTGAFHLKVIYEAKESIDEECAGLLGLTTGVTATVRVVLLNRGTTPVIFARSVIPQGSTDGSNKWLVNLGDQPLGDALYDVENMKRSEFQVAQLDRQHELFRRFAPALDGPGKTVWARRSRVTINGHPILINECFLSIPTN